MAGDMICGCSRRMDGVEDGAVTLEDVDGYILVFLNVFKMN
jgi:hypothetical protein